MRPLNFNHLFYFYVVAKEGSIKGAADKINVSQPTISDQLKLLEEHFGCLLFERKNRSLILNKQGELALSYAEKIFEMSNQLTSRLRNNVGLPKRSLDIGITHFMSKYFIYENILPLFEQKNVSINIKENERLYLLADLEDDRVDMVFTDSKDSLPSTLSSYRIGLNRTFVVAHKQYRKFKQNFPESLSELPFFNYTSDSSLRFEIELFFAKHSISPKQIGEADDIDLFQTVTESGHAFTIVPEVAKNRFCLNSDVIVLGEIKDLQTSVFGIIKTDYRGLGFKLLNDQL